MEQSLHELDIERNEMKRKGEERIKMQARTSWNLARKTSVLLTGLVAGACVMLLPGCDRYLENPMPTPAAPTTTPVPSKVPIPAEDKRTTETKKVEKQAPMTDQMITKAVEEKLHRDPVVSYDNVDLSVVKGVVTLEGSSENLLTKKRATRLAETVRGVRSVVNTIEVAPNDTIYDAKVYQDIKSAFALSASPDLIEKVDVAVNDGLVVLDGKVDSWQEQRVAVKRAKAVKGVKAVDDNVIVEIKQTRRDEDIKEDVETALKWDALVDHRLVFVSVNGGKVSLKGTVGSVAEKRRAIEDAVVLGAKGADDTELKVDLLVAKTGDRVPAFEVKSDKAVKEAIDDALLLDPRLPKEKVRVSVENGKVRLTGTVHGIQAKRAAERDARQTLGVHYVENRLRVKRLSEISDAAVEKNVRDAIRLDPYIVDDSAIAVSVRKGIVKLEGEATSLFEKMRADVAAANIRGAAQVKNRLQVMGTSDPLVFDPYLGDWYVHDFGLYEKEPRCKAPDDQIIQEKIKENLLWSPYVSATDVDVSVDLGAATLEGEVETWAERRAAIRAALSGGAQQVINKIAVAEHG